MTIEFRNAQSLRDILVPAHHPATHNLNRMRYHPARHCHAHDRLLADARS